MLDGPDFNFGRKKIHAQQARFQIQQVKISCPAGQISSSTGQNFKFSRAKLHARRIRFQFRQDKNSCSADWISNSAGQKFMFGRIDFKFSRTIFHVRQTRFRVLQAKNPLMQIIFPGDDKHSKESSGILFSLPEYIYFYSMRIKKHETTMA